MFAAAKASPGFVYTVGHTPLIFTNGHGHGYNTGGVAAPIEEPVQPLQYVRRPLYANNACRNNLGELVPCAFPSSAGASVYAYNNYPEIVPFVQEATGGVAAPVDLPAPADIPALENNDLEVPEAPSVVSVKKREAEPQAHG